MSAVDRELGKIWNSLRQNKSHRDDFLEEVSLKKIRGIENLRIPFEYPVTVLAGPNACGKSTVLFACACAYDVPGVPVQRYKPAALFPNFRSAEGGVPSDQMEQTEFSYGYLANGDRMPMIWRKGKTWNRSFRGRKGGKQPKRNIYLRTLANLTNPSEARSLLQINQRPLKARTIDPSLLLFAHRILPARYDALHLVEKMKGTGDLLVATLENTEDRSYSEFHMASGERAVLRLSIDISNLENALVLIDEVEAGLHPNIQRLLMLELQRLALRRNLQIIVTSHSPVVLDSVPSEARIFLERDEVSAEVRRLPAYRDIFQKALYGQSSEKLSILCEDEIAEHFILGVLDYLTVKMHLRHDDFTIGRNTGRGEFGAHIRTLGKFQKLENFVFVLDGDAKIEEAKLKQVGLDYESKIEPMFLPGNGSPEEWIWRTIERDKEGYAEAIGTSATDLAQQNAKMERLFQATDKQQETYKNMLRGFAEGLKRSESEVARIVGRREAERNSGEIAAFTISLEEQIARWRDRDS